MHSTLSLNLTTAILVLSSRNIDTPHNRFIYSSPIHLNKQHANWLLSHADNVDSVGIRILCKAKFCINCIYLV